MMASSKIVFITTGLAIGGAEMMLVKLLTHIDRNQFTPVVISLSHQDALQASIESLDIRVYNLAQKRGVLSITAIKKLFTIIKELKPDLIQGWMYHGNLLALLARWRCAKRVPVLWNIRQSLYDIKREKKLTAFVIKLGAKLSRRAQCIIYNAKKSADQHHYNGYYSKNTTLIANGFDVEQFKPHAAHRKRFRSELNVNDDTVLIGMIARYHPQKDFRTFLHAAHYLREQFSNVHFVLIGFEVDRQNNELCSYLRNLTLEGCVSLLGQRTGVECIYPGLDIYTLSSAWGEAFPNVIGEAMACAVPCVATDVGDCRDIIAETGLIVPRQNPQALAAAWYQLIKLSPQQRLELGQSARQRIIGHYSLASITRRYIDLYHQYTEA